MKKLQWRRKGLFVANFASLVALHHQQHKEGKQSSSKNYNFQFLRFDHYAIRDIICSDIDI